jgi:hypothetical protein
MPPLTSALLSALMHESACFEADSRFKGRLPPNYCSEPEAPYSAATTASPIATVPTCLQPGVRMSPVR